MRSRTSPSASDRLIVAAVAAAVLGLAFAGGGYATQSRAIAAIAVWWLVLLGVLAGLLPLAAPAPPARWLCGLLAAFALLTGLSAAWGDDAGAAVQGAALAALYAGVATLALLTLSERTAGAWLQGVAIALVALAGIALASRLLPGAFHDEVGAALPAARARLSYPLGYWNGLGLAMASAIVLLAWQALAGRTRGGRSAALAAIPLPALVLYLTSSRGAVLALLGGLGLLLAFERRRVALALELALAAAGSLALVGAVATRTAFVDGLDDALARDQRATVLALLAGTCAVLALARRLLDAPLQRTLTWRIGPRPACAGLAAVLALGAIAVVAADPGARLDAFREPPVAPRETGTGVVAEHLLSGSSSGRYQFWSAAWHAFEQDPIGGIGAGGYEAWWAQHSSLPAFVRNAHSLPLETLAELGAIGLALLLALAGVTLGAALLRRRAPSSPAVLAPAIALAGCGAIAAAIDWMWQLPAALLPALLGAVIATGLPAGAAAARRATWTLPAAGVAAAGLAVALLVLASDAALHESRAAARAGDLPAAARRADDARALEPWAAAPRLQLALVEERRGNLPAALRAAQQARDRAPLDWRGWLVLARLRARAGDAVGAQRALDRLRCLAPAAIFPPNVTLASHASINSGAECSDGSKRRRAGA